MTENEISHKIIGIALEIHKKLGPGLLESVYEECLAHELKIKTVNFERQKELPIEYKGLKLNCGYRIDLLVQDQLILELKSCDAIQPIHEAQLLTYLKLSGIKYGLLMNFNTLYLKDGI